MNPCLCTLECESLQLVHVAERNREARATRVEKQARVVATQRRKARANLTFESKCRVVVVRIMLMLLDIIGDDEGTYSDDEQGDQTGSPMVRMSHTILEQ